MAKLIADSMGQLTKRAIKDRLLDINNAEPMAKDWNEGYLNALADAGLIGRIQYGGLMSWLKYTL